MATFEQARITMPVVVAGVGVRRFLELHAHLDALIAELAVVAVPGTRTPVELEGILPLLDGLIGPFAGARHHSRDAALQARDAGRAEFTLDAELPIYDADAVARWNQLLDAADAASSQGLLLTPPALPELVELRRWLCAELASQVAVAG